jgi:hypothetical protein
MYGRSWLQKGLPAKPAGKQPGEVFISTRPSPAVENKIWETEWLRIYLQPIGCMNKISKL